MFYELDCCYLCGAEPEMKGTEERDGHVFALYTCPCCNSSLSAYKKYQKKQKSAEVSRPVVNAGDGGSAAPVEANRTAVANVAADVYKKAIGSTLLLVAKKGDTGATGTGTMISDKGYFITNAHVVTTLDKTRKKIISISEAVIGESGRKDYRFDADLVYADPTVDLALLKTDPDSRLVPVTFSSEDAFPGEAVYAIGNSKGEGLCIVEGIVSDVNRRVRSMDMIMISAPVTNGNSGGPVFDADGRLVGIVQSGHTDIATMNYVIPMKTIVKFLKDAQEKEDCDF